MNNQQIHPKIIIIEGVWTEIILHQYNHPEVQPRFVRKQMARLAFMDVHVLFADNPTAAAGMAWGLFHERENIIAEEILGNAGNDHSQGTSR
ncbi:unnamed protein product [marine sediment metagenome]|uniref:Uncharacterized protein n=1 Tax=marine sediment metagenome TaxID=412755 RepID=X0VCQ4_9ZZZZ